MSERFNTLKKNGFALIISASLFVPFFVYAAPRNIQGLIQIFLDILQSLIVLLIALALVGFFWGVTKYLINADSPDKRKEGAKFMLYGIIALFVMVSVWGLVAILAGTFGVSTRLPFLPGFGGGGVYGPGGGGGGDVVRDILDILGDVF